MRAINIIMWSNKYNMTINIEKRFGETPNSPDEAYRPYYSMRDELIEERQVPVRSVREVIDSIRNGIMPDMGAVVGLGHGVCAGFDLVTLERVSPKEAVVLWAPKSAVDDDTDRILHEGGITYTDDYGNMKIFGLIERYNGFNDTGHNVSKLSGGLVLRTLGINTPAYRIVEEDSGLLLARTSLNY